MHVVPGLSVNDLPPRPSVEDDALRLGVPVYQLRSAGLRLIGQSTYEVGGVLCQIALSHSVLRNPDDPEDPANFVTDEQLLIAAKEGLREDRPAWFKEQVLAMRYPAAWEAIVSLRDGFDGTHRLEERLAGHINHVAVNTLQSRRTFGSNGIPVLDSSVAASHAHPSQMNVDGLLIDALVIDSDPDLTGWAAKVGETTVLVVVDRDLVDPSSVRVERMNLPRRQSPFRPCRSGAKQPTKPTAAA